MINNDDRFVPTEFLLRHRPPAADKRKGFARRQASPETQTRRRLDAKRDARSNICPVCHMAKPATGQCC
jgi:hypothetical protein